MKKKKSGCLTRVAVLCVLLLLVGSFWYFDNNTIGVQTIEATSTRLPAAFDGFRAAVLSDIHGRVFGGDNGYLLKKTADANPDIIVVNGDLIDDPAQLEALPPLLDGLTKIAPVFYVSGNHEWATGCIDQLFLLLETSGVTVLRNEYRTITIDGEYIVVAGVDDPNGPYDMKTPSQLMAEIREKLGDPYVLMLAHRNDSINMWAELNVDTVICGHGHGGVVRLPFIGGVFGVDRSLFPRYTSGLYRMGGTDMIVSRGLGNSVVNFRVFNQPHLPVVELVKGE